MRRFLACLGFSCVIALMVSVAWASQDKEAITEVSLEMTEGLAN